MAQIQRSKKRRDGKKAVEAFANGAPQADSDLLTPGPQGKKSGIHQTPNSRCQLRITLTSELGIRLAL